MFYLSHGKNYSIFVIMAFGETRGIASRFKSPANSFTYIMSFDTGSGNTAGRNSMLRRLCTILVLGGSSALGDPEPPRFVQPIDCRIGETCFIQSYVDIDPGPAARDYTCGSNTYNGHDGVDFRLLSADAIPKGVRVLAAAPGVVKGAREGMADAIIDDANKQMVLGRECGNGVLIDHGDGWVSQYCHMHKGSLRVKVGDKVSSGQALGEVGYSGLAQFAHVHFAVRHNGVKIDPFTGHEMDGSCSATGGHSGALWAEAGKNTLTYHPGQILQLGFSENVPQLRDLEYSAAFPPPVPSSPALIFYARFMNLRSGDRVHLIVSGPSNLLAESTSEPLDRNKATYLSYAGKRRREASWPDGVYKGVAEIMRGDNIAERQERAIEIGGNRR